MGAAGSTIEARWSAEAGLQPQLILPDGCLDVLQRRGKLHVVGPMTHARWVHIGADPPTGIRFRPGTVRAWLGVSPHELVDVVVEASELPGLRDMRTLEDVARLARQAARPRAVGWAAAALSQAPATPIASLADELAWSQRHLRRLFVEEVGMAPKLFARIQRFRAVARRMREPLVVSLAEVALNAGYSDQAHMSREVKALTGESPRRLRLLLSDPFKT